METLKILQKSYFGKVKMIYIDPPYNTGNDSFIYPDRFAESREEYLQRIGDIDEDGTITREGMFHKNSKENGQYHSNWLNMMMPRLYLAKSLLRDDGVIFISIDDHEVANLKLLCDEIFGAENFLAQIVWQNSSRQSPQISVEHEYILVYKKTELALEKSWTKARDIALTLINQIDILKQQGKTIEEAEAWLSNEIDVYLEEDKHKGTKDFAWLGNYKNIDKEWRIYYAVDLTGEGPGPARFFNGKSIPAPPGRHWMSQEYINELADDNRIIFRSDRAYRKLYITESFENLKSILRLPTRNGSELLKQLLGKDIFDKPKPHNLIKKFVYHVVNQSDIILDFFSGSGSTAHAVMQLNREDGGNRQYICVQMAEPCKPESEAYKAGYRTIADIAMERIRRAGQQIRQEIEAEREKQRRQLDLEDRTEPEMPDLGFKVFRLSESNFKQWRAVDGANRQEWEQQMMDFINPVAPNATTVNMVYELLLKNGKDLNSTIENKNGYILVNGTEMALVLEEITPEIIDGLLAAKPDKVIVLDKLFEDNDQLKTNTALQMKDAGIPFRTI